MKVAIVGGGVGGLALATALADSGIDLTVFERGSEVAHTGLGLLLLENGLDALSSLGLRDDICELSNPLDLAVLRDPRGEVFRRAELQEHRGIARFDLMRLLASGVPRQQLRWSRAVVGVEAADDGVELRFPDGRAERFDLVVGADGVHSAVRGALSPDWRAVESPVRELVSTCVAPDVAAKYDRTFLKTLDPGGGLAVGVVPAAHGMVIWFLQYDARRWPDLPRSSEARSLFARGLVGNWADPVRDLVERTDYSGSHVWRTVEARAPAPLALGRVALMGDAAHPNPTLTSQGANAALVDAVVLADVLRSDPSPEGFAAYAAQRLPRLEAIRAGGEVLIQQFLAPPTDNPSIPVVH